MTSALFLLPVQVAKATRMRYAVSWNVEIEHAFDNCWNYWISRDHVTCVNSPLMYPGYFPTENPYSSHIPRKAVFPNYDTAHDPHRQRGVGQPPTKQPQMPASAHPIIVASKARGRGQGQS